jgi:Uma2 family endonuclease
MAAAQIPPTITAEEYLATSYSDGDREFLDGVILERNVGNLGHSALQKILTVHLSAFEEQLDLMVLPECRLRIDGNRYRIPDIAVMVRPFRQTDQVLLDVPFLIIEILSPRDEVKDTLRRFRDYEKLGVPHIVHMDPEDRTTFLFANGDLLRRDVTSFDVPGRGTLPFDSQLLLARLDRR